MGMCWSHVGKPEPTALMPGPALISGEGQWIVVKKQKTRCVWGGKRVFFRERSVRLVKTDFCSGSRCWCVTVFGGTEAESWDTAASVETYKLFICCHVTTSNNRGGRWNHQVEVEDCRILIWGMWNATTLKTWHNRGPPLTVGLYEEWDVTLSLKELDSMSDDTSKQQLLKLKSWPWKWLVVSVGFGRDRSTEGQQEFNLLYTGKCCKC